jgi:hypothetical protein
MDQPSEGIKQPAYQSDQHTKLIPPPAAKSLTRYGRGSRPLIGHTQPWRIWDGQEALQGNVLAAMKHQWASASIPGFDMSDFSDDDDVIPAMVVGADDSFKHRNRVSNAW